MQFKVLPAGFAAYACFASSVNAGPIGLSHNRAANSASLTAKNTNLVAREPQLVVLNTLPPIYTDIQPDGLIQVITRPAHSADATQKANATDTDTATLETRGKAREPTFFDKRPERYISPVLPYTEVANRTARDEDLSKLWSAVPEFKKLDNGNYYGSEKWFLLQKFNVAIVSDKDDNHEDINFAARVFGTTPETIKWFSNQMATSQSLREDEHWPEFAFYEPIDHYNWIRKAHSVLSRMTKVEQRAMNDLIDNIDKQSTEGLYKIYERFEMIQLEFPNRDLGNDVKSSRPPIQLYDWNSKQHPRHAAFRPIDALARYAIPATDSSHDDWTSQTAIKLAHMKPEDQRYWRDQFREIHTSYAPTPSNLKAFYDILDVDWRGRDSNAKKAEVADVLCVRELVFADMPKKKKPMSREWDFGRVAQQPAMVNACTDEQREARLKDLFYIERWDADHKDLKAYVSARNVKAEKERGKLGMLGEEIGGKLDTFAELLKPGNDKIKENLKELETQVDHDLQRYQENINKLEKAIDPLVHDVGTLGLQAWGKLKDVLLISL